MIKSYKGKVSAEGSKAEFCADLICVFHGFLEEGIFTKDELKDFVEQAAKSPEELAREDKEIDEILDKFDEFIDEIIKGRKERKND